jgi:hypothetical protein
MNGRGREWKAENRLNPRDPKYWQKVIRLRVSSKPEKRAFG